MEDIHIIDLYWQRNPDAIGESNRKYGSLLGSIAYNILSSREDSEECVNDTYVKAWDSIPPQKPDSLAAYLGRIVRNLSINRWHSNRTQKRSGAGLLLSELSDCVPSPHNVERETDFSLVKDTVIAWLLTLPQDDRVLFLRRYWFGDSLHALALECSITPNQLAGRMYRLRQKLKTALEKEEIFL